MAKLVNQNSQSSLSVYLQTPVGSVLVDADSFPTLEVRRSDGTIKSTFSGTTTPAIVRLGLGKYAVTWQSDEAGEFTLVWSYSVQGNAEQTSEPIVIYDIGSGALNAQDENTIAAFITRTLGEPIVQVELTPDHLNDAIVEAKQWYQALIGQEKYIIMAMSDSGGAYDVAPDCMSVTQVAFNLKHADLWDQFNWAGVELGPLNWGFYGGWTYDGYGLGGGYSYLVQAMQYREQARNILSIDRDWYWDYAQRKLIITPIKARVGTQAAVWYASREVDLAVLQTYEFWLIKQYSLAVAMCSLGWTRSKYTGLPSATGEITLNGENLISNAEMLKESMTEKALKLRAPTQFFAQ